MSIDKLKLAKPMNEFNEIQRAIDEAWQAIRGTDLAAAQAAETRLAGLLHQSRAKSDEILDLLKSA